MSSRSRRSGGGAGDSSRKAALEKLKAAKARGEVHKAEVSEAVDSLYDEVPEESYARLVQHRQEDDWIVDDDGSGYVEDGREIFDEEDAIRGKKKEKKENKFAPKNRNAMDPKDAKKSIKGFFGAGKKAKAPESSKRKEEEDAILDELMGELEEAPVRPILPPPPKKPRTSAPKARHNPFSTAKAAAPPRQLSPPPPSRARSASPPPSPPSNEDTEMEEEIADTLEPEPEASEPATEDVAEQEPKVAEVKPEPTHRGFAASVDVKEESESWDFFGEDASESKENDVKVESSVGDSDLPLTTDDDGNRVLAMYWLDAYEDAHKHPGRAYLFGKVQKPGAGKNEFQSCCLTIKNLERVLFFLPRERRLLGDGSLGEELDFADVHAEITQLLLHRFHIKQFRAKKSVKKWAMGGDEVPAEETAYLEVRYSGHLPALPNSLSGQTFSVVLGTTNSTLESMLLEKNLRGPGWLKIKNPEATLARISWCGAEGSVESTEGLGVWADDAPPPPPLTLVSLSLLTVPHSTGRHDQIVGASILTTRNFSLSSQRPKGARPYDESQCLVCKPSEGSLPYDLKAQIAKQGLKGIQVLGNERALLGLLLALIQRADPDVIIGHDLLSVGVEQLMSRVGAMGSGLNWSRLSRLRRTGAAPRLAASKSALAEAITGRLLLDSAVAAKELVKARSYDLCELSSQLLSARHEEILPTAVLGRFASSATLLPLLGWLLSSALLSLRLNLSLNSLPLFTSITQIVGGLMGRTLLGGRSERNEFLLLHAFHDKGFLFPDKFAKKAAHKGKAKTDGDGDADEAKKKGPQYSGGLVLEPKKGLYDKYVLLLDFNSLYPSIIQEYNICFTTVREGADGQGAIPGPGEAWGILPTEIKRLVDSRREVKALMKATRAPELLAQYNIRQLGLKLTANSMYGCLGFAHSRFHAKALAALVTAKGRDILMQTKDLVERKGYDVIYGDTDSIMINTNSHDIPTVMKIGRTVKAEVNKLYRLVELEIDGIYRSLLLLKKKKYAGIAVEIQADGSLKTKRELKGLDIVRRDWAGLAKAVGTTVVDEILSEKPQEEIVLAIHDHLEKLAANIRDGNVPIEDFEIHKALTRSPADYADKRQAHVSVALRLNTDAGWHIKGGDTVSYLICRDGTDNPPTQRAYHQSEVKANPKLEIDVNYYLSSQVHPVVSRLCEPMDGTDAARLALSLGLDPSSYARSAAARARAGEEEADGEFESLREAGGELDWESCEPLLVPCSKDACPGKLSLSQPLSEDAWSLGAACPDCGTKDAFLQPASAALEAAVRVLVSAYYAGWLACEDAACGWETRRVPTRLTGQGKPLCPHCMEAPLVRKLSDRAVYTQLAFFRRLFDVQKCIGDAENVEQKKRLKSALGGGLGERCERLFWLANRALDSSAYSQVDLASLFRPLQPDS